MFHDLPNETKLAPKAQHLLQTVRRWASISKQVRRYLFPFADLPPSARLRYELTQWNNYTDYLTLFQNDPSPFVDKRFKSKEALDEYAVGLLEIMCYDIKRAGCDWILRLTDGTPVGVLHFYDLSKEQENLTDEDDDFFNACSIGYAVAAPYRRQGYAFEACSHLLHHAKVTFNRYKLQASTLESNLASVALLKKLGFRQVGTSFRLTNEQLQTDNPSLIFGKKLS